MAEGYHAVSYDDGDKYRGQWNGEGKRHGLGVLNFADGSTYMGEFANGLNSGSGVLTFSDKSKFEGQFADGKYDGLGVFSKSDGTKYEGQFKSGRVDGQGKITFPDGTSGKPRQEGTFVDRKLVTGGKQASVVKQAVEAADAAKARAKAANDLKE